MVWPISLLTASAIAPPIAPKSKSKPEVWAISTTDAIVEIERAYFIYLLL